MRKSTYPIDFWDRKTQTLLGQLQGSDEILEFCEKGSKSGTNILIIGGDPKTEDGKLFLGRKGLLPYKAEL